MYDCFSPNESELKSIIEKNIDSNDRLVQAQTIQTGWTNITMDVQTQKTSYIFRFPRNYFFARMMIKDCHFCQFLKGKVSVQTPDMQLKFDNNRPFSMHEKIKGVSLTSRMDNLSAEEKKRIAEDIVQFLSELHSIPVSEMPADIAESLNDFLTSLATVHKGNYNLDKHQDLIHMEQTVSEPVIVHGDFNPGNILLDKEAHLSGVIDFAFASISDRHADIGRFVGRATPSLGQAVLDAYRKQSACDDLKVQHIVDLFKYVECKYVQYMQAEHPEIIIPEAVLAMAEQEGKRFRA